MCQSMFVQACGGHKSISNIFLNHSPPLQGLSMKLFDYASEILGFSCLCLSKMGLTDMGNKR